MINLNELGERLKTTREARGLSLRDVTKATGISASTLSRLEADPSTRPDMPNWFVLSSWIEGQIPEVPETYGGSLEAIREVLWADEKLDGDQCDILVSMMETVWPKAVEMQDNRPRPEFAGAGVETAMSSEAIESLWRQLS